LTIIFWRWIIITDIGIVEFFRIQELDSLQPLNLTVPSSFEVTESEGTEPKVTESEVTKSKVTESKATESEVTQSNIPELNVVY
jgi:3-deoxy-D-arabino-heptulosonate 7-phosphate (DAHP) synthase class II